MERQPNTEYILSLSYGKDSIACLEAIKLLGYPLDRIIHAEVWATDTIPADLPPMVEFKAYADKIIEEKYGIKVEHIYAVRGGERLTYSKEFYRVGSRGKFAGCIYGFPCTVKPWCNSRLKVDALSRIGKDDLREVILPYSETKETKDIRERERERWLAEARSGMRSKLTTQMRGTPSNQFSASQSQEGLGATAISNLQPYGFPISIGRGNWCTQLKQRVFTMRRCARREEKYCAVSRNCR